MVSVTAMCPLTPGMRSLRFQRCARAFTRVELLIVIAAGAMLAAVVWPALGNDAVRAQRAVCANNLHRIGQALASWAADHGELYPWLVYESEGGTRGSIYSDRSYSHFAALSNEVGTPSVFACPSDPSKAMINTFAAFNDRGASYLISHPEMIDGRAILSGDPNLRPKAVTTESCPIFDRARWMTRPNTNAAWSLNIHVRRGHLLFNDGSVESTDDTRLRSILSPPGVTNNFHYIAPEFP